MNLSDAAEDDARCSRCDEVVGAFVIEGCRATIRLSTSSHGDTLPISCPNVIPPAACPDCGHQHTPNGCTGDSTPSGRWAGVTPAVCDCDTGP